LGILPEKFAEYSIVLEKITYIIVALRIGVPQKI
jgi:hypothetical protein